MYGFNILCNVFTGRPVASRRSLDKQAVLVNQADSETIQFGLGIEFELVIKLKPVMYTFEKRFQFVLTEYIIQG